MSETISILALLAKKLQDISGATEVKVEIPKNLEFGDLTCNVAMIQAGSERAGPMDLAKRYVVELNKDKVLKKNFSKIEVISPGFINFYYSTEVIQRELNEFLSKPDYGRQNLGKNQKVVIEYSSPNTNKPLHVGHLRNNAIGMALANVHEFLGYQVVKTQVINDRGVHIMKSLWAYQKYSEGETPKSKGLKGDKLVGDYYIKYNQAEKDNPKLKDEIQALLVKWENKDKDIRKLWQQLNEWVYSGWEETYKKFGSKFDKNFYESELYDKGRDVIKKAETKRLVYKNKQGAVVIDLSKYNLGGRDSGEKILLRPDGTTVYITQDIYLAKKRYEDYKFDKLIYVVGDEQIYHFNVLFKVLEIFGFDWYKKLYHYYYAHVFLPEGKMKSREGLAVPADDLLNVMYEAARKEIIKRDSTLSKKEIEKRGWTIAMAALKYWFLKNNPKSIIHFDPKQSLDFEGNTGSYILYTYVRLNSILNKAGKLKTKIANIDLPPAELKIIRLMMQLPQVLKRVENNYDLNYLCEYAFNLASDLNSFYHRYPVLKCEDKKLKQTRLTIVNSGSMVLETIIKLLNIDIINKM